MAIADEAEPLVITSVGLGLVTVIAVEFLPIHQRNIRRKMPLMIEAQHIRVANFLTTELEFRMAIPKRRKRLRVASSGSLQFEAHPLRRSWMPSECLRRKLHSFLCRCLHDFTIAMARHAIGTQD
jgi:hypothetical protein